MESFQVGEHLEVWGGGGLRGKDMEALHPFLILCPMHLLCLVVPELYPFIINWRSSKYCKMFLSSVSFSSKLINPKEEVVGTSDL